MDVYNEWVRQKDLAGMAEETHSKFATYFEILVKRDSKAVLELQHLLHMVSSVL